MMRLNAAALGSLPPGVQGPEYDRARVRAGIAHLSVGNFHRAHQAWYVEQLLTQPDQRQWALHGIGLIDDPRERAKADALQQQDGLYSLTRYDADGGVERRVIGAILKMTFAPAAPRDALATLCDPAIRIVSLTITEGGYRLDSPDVLADRITPETPRSAFGYIVAALRHRRAAGAVPFTVLSCDNLMENGDITRHAVLAQAEAVDAGLASWISASVAFPNSMVDGITPATSEDDRARLNAASGLDDLVPVFSESFMDWVIEDRFCNGRPMLERLGVRLVQDVRPYEQAKLHMLNAGHSMLAYPAILAGYTRVDEAMRDPLIRGLVGAYMERDAAPMLAPAPGLDLAVYRDLLLARFANPAVGDQVARLAGGGAVKLPVFLAPPLRYAVTSGGDTRRLAFCIACFLNYLRGIDDRGTRFPVQEPALSQSDLALATDSEPRAALRMAKLAELGVPSAGPLADEIIRRRTDLTARGALAVLAEIMRD